jgi:hypothetical protein
VRPELARLAAMSTEQRRVEWLAEMGPEELDGYETEHRRRGLEPYEVLAIAERRRALARRAR